MKNYKQILAIAILSLVVGAVYIWGTRSANTQSVNASAPAPTPIKSATEDRDDEFPMVVFDSPDGTDSLSRDKRKVRNRKFDNWNWVKQISDNENHEITFNTDWQLDLPALPTSKSDAIVLGNVTSAQAFLSNDKSGVYSEFLIDVTKVIKDNSVASISRNEPLILQRAGGRVKYSAGGVARYSIKGQEMPRVNGKYIFFLVYDESEEVHTILTAYEILSGKIAALDGKGESPLAGFNFERFNGMSEFEFLNQVRDSISAPVEDRTLS